MAANVRFGILLLAQHGVYWLLGWQQQWRWLLLQQQYLAGFSMNEAELAGMQSANEYGQNRTRFNFRRR
jgi:hypothetical protein